jgi:hypothetical protein
MILVMMVVMVVMMVLMMVVMMVYRSDRLAALPLFHFQLYFRDRPTLCVCECV